MNGQTAKQWYYLNGLQETVGPLPYAELKRLMNEGKITSSTFVAEENGTEWIAYSEVAKKMLPSIPIQEKEIVVGAADRTASGIGGCLGVVMGLFGLLAGILLCCTGLGAILGIPMIIGALGFMGLGGEGLHRMGAKNKRVLNGECPYCGHRQEVKVGELGMNCPACLKRFVVKDRVFVRVNE